MLSSELNYVQTDATTPNIVGSTMLGVVASVLAVVCKRMQQLPTTLGAAVHRGKDTTHKTLETMCHARTWPQQCWKSFSCANGSNSVALRFSDLRDKRNVGSYWLNRLTGFKLCATTPNNMQQGVQINATCNIEQCWELLDNSAILIEYCKIVFELETNNSQTQLIRTLMGAIESARACVRKAGFDRK